MIRPVAVCVFRRGGRVLVAEGVDPATGERFARPLGGGIEEGETSARAVEREVREEIAADVVGLRLLGVLENLFTYGGRARHEIVFVYDGRLADGRLYEAGEVAVLEAGWALPAVWRPPHAFGPGYRLVPDGLLELLDRDAGA